MIKNAYYNGLHKTAARWARRVVSLPPARLAAARKQLMRYADDLRALQAKQPKFWDRMLAKLFTSNTDLASRISMDLDDTGKSWLMRGEKLTTPVKYDPVVDLLKRTDNLRNKNLDTRLPATTWDLLR